MSDALAAGTALRGLKVELRPFTALDLTDAYVAWLNDSVVTRYSNQRFLRHDRASCERYLQGFAGTANRFLAIRRLDTGAAIGTMTAYIAPHHGTADMGILLGERSAWGHGFGFDAWTTLMQALLALPGMRKVTAGTLACNAPMLRIMERSGMHLEGVRRAQELVDGAPQDLHYHARFRG